MESFWPQMDAGVLANLSRESQGAPSEPFVSQPCYEPEGLFPVIVPDPSLSPREHARLYITRSPMETKVGENILAFISSGRSYLKLEQRDGPYPVLPGSVIKLGACSLEFEHVRVPENYNSTPQPTPDSADKNSALPPSAMAETACYICLAAGNPTESLLYSHCSCGKPVHASCLFHWVESRKARECCICKGLYPLNWLSRVVEQPLLLMRVVRHVRGLRWGSQREFVVSFREKKVVSIGHFRDNEVALPDFSCSNRHAKVTFSPEEGGGFSVEDMGTPIGSYLLIPSRKPYFLPLPSGRGRETSYTIKIGKSDLVLKLQLAPLNRPPSNWGAMGYFKRFLSLGGVVTPLESFQPSLSSILSSINAAPFIFEKPSSAALNYSGGAEGVGEGAEGVEVELGEEVLENEQGWEKVVGLGQESQAVTPPPLP